MRGSAKGQQPAELRIWKETQLANDIEPAYHDLQQPERGATERSLFAEQTGQCVYCGRKIALERNQYCHIEHFRPQKEYPALQLDYSNLFLSCGPRSEHGTRNTCGAHKDNWFDEDCHIPPAPEFCANRFRFRSSGHIAGDGSPEADTMISKLNLNHPALVVERQDIIEDLDRRLNDREALEPMRQDYLDQNPGGARPSFANVAIRYLEEQVNAEI